LGALFSLYTVSECRVSEILASVFPQDLVDEMPRDTMTKPDLMSICPFGRWAALLPRANLCESLRCSIKSGVGISSAADFLTMMHFERNSPFG
jgi:hypothetical protein